MTAQQQRKPSEACATRAKREFASALVTGAAGFLGSFLAEALLGRGCRVVGIDSLFRGRRENFAHLESHPAFRFHRLDLLSPADLRELGDILRQHTVDTVFHYAAINGTRHFYDHPWGVLSTNAETTINLLRVLEGLPGLKKIVYASSSEVYGDPQQVPTPEEHPVVLRPLMPRDSYAAGKALGEFYVRHYAGRTGIPFLILRIFNTYGERMDTSEYGQVIPEFIRKLLKGEEFTIIGDGSQMRSFCYVEDNVRLTLALAERVENEIVNVGSQEMVSILELARRLHRLADKPFHPRFLPPREGDHPRRCPSIRKAMELTEDQPRVGLEEGLRRVWQYYQARLLPPPSPPQRRGK